MLADYNKNYEPGDETWRGAFVNPVLNNAIEMQSALLPETEEDVYVAARFRCRVNGDDDNVLSVLWRIFYGTPRVIAYHPLYMDSDCAKLGINGLTNVTLIGEMHTLNKEGIKKVINAMNQTV